MGTPVPESVEPGNDCALCTIPPGPLWEPGETPKYIFAYFAGIKKCAPSVKQPPNGRTFKLTQTPGNNCTWQHVGASWQIEYRPDLIAPDASQLVLIEAVSGVAMFSSRSVSCPEEPHIFVNDQAACILLYGGAEGVGVIHWMGVVLGIVVMMSLPSNQPIMHEIFVKDETTIVHKFCLPKFGMNVKLLMSP